MSAVEEICTSVRDEEIKITIPSNVKGISDRALLKKARRLRRKEEKKIAQRGDRISGRNWKDPNIKKFSSIKNVNVKPKVSVKSVHYMREERKLIQERERQIKEAKEARREHVRERCRINKIRTLENQRKAEKVQIIKNAQKIKKMKKKQVRQIERRDISELKSKNLVS